MVDVGSYEERQTFDVHEDLLKAHSRFFCAALNKEWKEGQERKVSLPEDDPEHFELSYHFLYTGRIYSKSAEQDPHGVAAEEVLLAYLWTLGDKLNSSSFMDAILDTMISGMESDKSCPMTLHEIIYPDSARASCMKRFLVDVAAWEWSENAVAEAAQDKDTPREFFRDFASALHKFAKSGRQGVAPYKGSTCCYHEHVVQGKPCYRTMF